MAPKQSNSGRLSVFKGREGKLNLAIFLVLALTSPLTIIELQKQVSKQRGLEGTYYASLTKRLRNLREEVYIRENKVGREAATYQLTNKALLAMFLDANCMQEIVDKASEKNRAFLLLAFMNSVTEEKP